jgi:hypothetical protein
MAGSVGRASRELKAIDFDDATVCATRDRGL